MTAEAIRVGVAAGGAALRAGLLSLLAGLPGLDVVASASTPEELPFDLPLDVLVWAYPRGGQAVSLPKLEQPAARLLFLVSSPDRLPDRAALPEGQAWGLLPEEASAEELGQAILALAEGLTVLYPVYLSALAGNSPPVDRHEALTRREVEVLEQLALGQTNKQIALALRISEHTVKFHISTIYGKLGVLNRAEAVQVGIRQGWITV